MLCRRLADATADWWRLFLWLPAGVIAHGVRSAISWSCMGLRWICRRLLPAFFVLAVGTLVVVGTLLWNASDNPKSSPVQCQLEPVTGATVHAEIKVAVDGLTYPRVSTDLVTQIPISAPGSERLLLHEDDPLRQSAFACLFHADKAFHEMRVDAPKVVRVGDVIEVSDHVHVDILGPGEFWAGTTEVWADVSTPWHLTVHPPPGLTSARWDIAVTAPDGWLTSPIPWKTAEIGPNRVRWPEFTTNTSAEPASARVGPDLTTGIVLRARAPHWKAWAWGVGALSALCFAVLAFFVLGARRHQFEPVARSTARQAVLPIALVAMTVGLLSVLSAVYEHRSVVWWQVEWYLNIGFAVLLSSVALVWWLPRSFVIVVGSAMGTTLWPGFRSW